MSPPQLLLSVSMMVCVPYSLRTHADTSYGCPGTSTGCTLYIGPSHVATRLVDMIERAPVCAIATSTMRESPKPSQPSWPLSKLGLGISSGEAGAVTAASGGISATFGAPASTAALPVPASISAGSPIGVVLLVG